jgi:hypothetical protein
MLRQLIGFGKYGLFGFRGKSKFKPEFNSKLTELFSSYCQVTLFAKEQNVYAKHTRRL